MTRCSFRHKWTHWMHWGVDREARSCWRCRVYQFRVVRPRRSWNVPPRVRALASSLFQPTPVPETPVSKQWLSDHAKADKERW